MSEALQIRRRADRVKDWLAGIAVTVTLAVVLAVLAVATVAVVGIGVGDADWHRTWVDVRVAKLLEPLDGVPLLGPLVTRWLDSEQGWLPGAWRDLLAFATVLAVPCGFAGARIGPALIARYDDEALRPAPPSDLGLRWAGPLGAVQARAWDELAHWCGAGTGNGRAPFWRPWALPDVPERLSIAVMVGENGGGKSHLAEAFAKHLGRHSESPVGGEDSASRVWRRALSAKWHELWWWRRRHPSQPWDCGYLVEDPAARARLAQFRPRRPTLMIADELRDGSLDLAVQALTAARVDFRHPVRLLIIDVTLPSALELRPDSVLRRWRAAAHDLGVVHVIDFKGARFQVAQLRALVGAQPPALDGTRETLMGDDEEWAPVTSALDEQPILVAEAVRWVRENKLRYADLQDTDGLPHLGSAMARRQDDRSTPILEPDALGRRRELLRERVLRDRARHRRAALLHAMGANAGDVAYHALMVATASQGGSAGRLGRLLGLRANPLTRERLEAAFAHRAADDWVPPVKPAVVADELLRLHFDVPVDAPLPVETQERVRELLRHAWMLNPGGTRNTVARWSARRPADEFAIAMRSLPTLADLKSMSDPGMRVELVRAFVELAVLHGGDLEPARAALAALETDEWPGVREKVQSLLLRPDAAGVPALVLWLDLQRLTFPPAGTLTRAEAEAFGVRLAGDASQLLNQCVVVSVPVHAVLENALDSAVFEALPLLARLREALAASTAFCALVCELDGRVIGGGHEGALGQPNRLRERLRTSLLAAWVQARADGAVGKDWPQSMFAALERLDGAAVAPPLEAIWTAPGVGALAVDGGAPELLPVARALALWCRCHQSDSRLVARGLHHIKDLARHFPVDAEFQSVAAEALADVCWACKDSDVEATARAAQEVADIAARFESHQRIQHLVAKATRILVWAQQDSDAEAAALTAETAAHIAARFEHHAGIQHEAVMAWRFVSWACKDTDPRATEQAAQKAADIAARFVRHEGIQDEAAESWKNVCWAYHSIDAQVTAQAAQRVADIAERFRHHEQIQHAASQAWRDLAWAHKDTDAEATSMAVSKVVEIAARFQHHQGIQHEAAKAWRVLAWAYRGIGARTAAQAVHKVAEIAARFDEHERIQYEAAQAWRVLCFVHRHSDSKTATQAAEKVAYIAARFAHSEDVQYEAAQVCRILSSMYSDTDPQATARAAQEGARIASRFERCEDIQREAAEAWRHLSSACQGVDAQATREATLNAAAIAERFEDNDGIQAEAAIAWRNLAGALRNIDAPATAYAAQRAADVAARFASHESIPLEAAHAWYFTTLAAVKFSDEALMARATSALEKLAGSRALLAGSRGAQEPTGGRIAEQLQLARVAVDSWRAKRGKGT